MIQAGKGIKDKLFLEDLGGFWLLLCRKKPLFGPLVLL